MNRLLELLLNDNYYINNIEIVDEDVNHCLLQMYFYLMIDDKQNKENIWKSFHESYENLTLEKQEYVKNDFLKIIKIQEENHKQLKKER